MQEETLTAKRNNLDFQPAEYKIENDVHNLDFQPYQEASDIYIPEKQAPKKNHDFQAYQEALDLTKNYPYNTWANFDYLSESYPRFKNQIQKARIAGVTDDKILAYITNKIEPKINFIGNPDQVDKWLGRTQEGKKKLRDYLFSERLNLYKTMFPDKKDEDIANAMEISALYNISPDNLLKYPEVFKQLTNDKILRENWLESMYREGNNYIVNNDIGSVGVKAMLGLISREDALKQKQELSKKIIDDPLIKNFGNEFFGGGAKILTQQYKNLGKGFLYGGVAAGAGYLAGLVLLGQAGSGAALGYRVGMLAAQAQELFEDQAGNDYLNLLEMKDNEGKPMDENAARVAACFTGAITVATELVTLPGIVKLLPGGNSILNLAGLNREHVINAVQNNPVVRDAFSRLAIDTSKGIGWGTINNIVETLGGELGVPLAQAISGQPFQKYDYSVIPSRIWEATTSSIRDFSASAIPNLLLGVYRINRGAKAYKQFLSEAAQQIGTTPEALESEIAENIALLQNQRNNQRQGITTETESETETATNIETTTNTENETEILAENQENAGEVEQTAQEHSQNEINTNSNSEYEFVFIPSDKFENLKAEKPDNEAIAKIQGIEAENETGLTKQQFQELKQTAPDFVAENQNDIRYGADATTISEQVTRMQRTDPEKADYFHSDENQEKMKKAAQQLLNLGETQERAELISEIYGVINSTMKINEGTTLPDIEIKTTEQIEAENSDMSRLNPEYDINNPETWPNQERSQEYINTQAQRVSDLVQNTRDFLDVLTGKKAETEEITENIETENQTENGESVIISLENENLKNVKRKAKNLVRDELIDYTRTRKNAAEDFVKSFSAKVLDSDKYENNSKYPTGKTRYPDASYEFEHFEGRTKIYFAKDKADLKVKIKIPGDKKGITFSIKNYRKAGLATVLDDVFGGMSLQGLKLTEIPTAQYLQDALTKFWNEQDLHLYSDNLVKVHKENFTNLQTIGITKDNLDVVKADAINDENALEIENPAKNVSIPEGAEADVIHENIPEIDRTGFTEDQIQDERVQTNKNTIEEPAPPVTEKNITSREYMPQEARLKLAQDEAAWNKTVDDILADQNVTTKSKKEVPVMTTPLVFTLVGAKHLPVKMVNGKIKTILGSHPTMTAQILKDTPRALTDPIAIFKSDSSKGLTDGLVVMTELTDENGASVLSAFHLDQRKGTINKLASIYAKDNSDGTANNQWFEKQVENDNLLYINREKAKNWSNETGVNLLEYYDENAKNENDLINLWNERKGYYYTDPSGVHVSSISFKFGKALVEMLRSSNDKNFAATIHDVGHVTFDMMEKLANSGSIQMKADFETILRHAEVTREEYFSDTKRKHGGPREKAHEYFANAFMVYLSEGKAPAKGLQKTFDRIRGFLLEIYDDIVNQLGVKNFNDEVRAVFDRLLTIGDDKNSTVLAFVKNDMRVQNQIAAYEQQLRDAETEFNSQLEAQQTFNDFGEVEINEEALKKVQEFSYYEDWNEIEREDLQTKQEELKAIVNIIKDNGGVRAQDIIDGFGKDLAKDISKKWRNLYRIKGTPVDKIAQVLYDSGFKQFKDSNTLLDWLDNVDKDILKQKISDVNPFVKINTDTFNALLADRGIEGAVQYLKQRLEFLGNNKETEAERNEIQDFLQRIDPDFVEINTKTFNALLADRGIEGTVQYLKQRLEFLGDNKETEVERNEIQDFLQRLDPDNEIKEKKKKKKFTQKDISQAIRTAYKLGEDKEQTLQKFKERISKTEYQEKLNTQIAKLNEKNQNKIAKTKQKYLRKIGKIEQRLRNLRTYQAEVRNKNDIKSMVRQIFKMSNNQNIIYAKQQEIQNLLEDYNLKRTEIKKKDIIRNYLFDNGEQYTTEYLRENGLTEADVEEYFNKIHIEDMTIDEVKKLFADVKGIFEQGRREFELWNNEKKIRRINMFSKMAGHLDKIKEPKEIVIKDGNSIRRNFKGGIIQERAISYWNNIKTAGRFLETLGDDFRVLFSDLPTEKLGEADQHIHRRENNFINLLKNSGLNVNSLSKHALKVDGIEYNWDEVMEIYAGMKNEKSAQAILWGNFVKNS